MKPFWYAVTSGRRTRHLMIETSDQEYLTACGKVVSLDYDGLVYSLKYCKECIRLSEWYEKYMEEKEKFLTQYARSGDWKKFSDPEYILTGKAKKEGYNNEGHV